MPTPTAVVILEIADAVATVVDALPAMAGTVRRAYVPVYDLRDLTTLRCTVVPRELSLVALSRRDDDHDYIIDVAVQKKVATVEPAEIDPLMLLPQSIADAFRGQHPASYPAALCVAVTNRPIFDPGHLDEHRVFTTVVSLTFRVARTR